METVATFSLCMLVALVSGHDDKVMSNDDPILLANPNLLVHYYSKENVQRLQEYHGHLNLTSPSVVGEEDEDKFDSLYFSLYTPEEGAESPHLFTASSSAYDLLEAGFQPQRDTTILVHGFSSNNDKFSGKFVTAYFGNSRLQNKNIIGIDWRHYASFINYIGAAQHAVLLGDYVGQVFGDLLVKQLGVSPVNIHAIGHSLGAHFIGHMGRQIALVGKGKMGRATGLDPAKPWFDVTDESNRIQISDAKFVDIIHTNSGDLWDGCLSFTTNLGHIDFYPNGGQHQPGCVPACTPATCPIKNLVDLLRKGCSHRRSEYYYIESIGAVNNYNTDFESHFCDDYEDFADGVCKSSSCSDVTCAHMGERLEIYIRDHLGRKVEIPNGGYYLKTADKPPYSLS